MKSSALSHKFVKEIISGLVSRHDFSRAEKRRKTMGFTGCGKTLVYRRVLHLRRNFSPFRPFSLRISAFVLR
ncbi:MAG: hypothetical protein ACYCSP_16495, partial [Acidobacteriaceae bacterium]